MRPESTSPQPITLAEESIDVQSIIDERRPSRLKPIGSTGYGLYVKEEEEDEVEKDRKSSSVMDAEVKITSENVASISGVELRIFVDDEVEVEHREQETQAGSSGIKILAPESGNSGVVGKNRRKSPGGD